ncbi:hypothetical protein HMPREF0239_04937 [Clostridium sp. ATCC BAA-442]|uniref:Uncharacterized protein n=1 Tax=Flavonifractor plautii ATCC 29863 TaxID=411475 RepID=G9YMY9_FLAPL|nr:hypothetical protein HMPREF0372_00861 [Flavonifractor plautii ATCC 29863]ERI62479.1 hypothetical protein HMPREF0239_04937 [Clostridium sp. ATCC BAA-442]
MRHTSILRSKILAQGQFTCPEHAKRHQGSHPAWPDGRDAVAATLILEGYLTFRRRGG